MAAARIISLVPSWTETLFVIGAGDRIVGCTRFCEQPRDRVQGLPKVARGEGLGAFALSEPRAGSDVASLYRLTEPPRSRIRRREPP